MIKTIVTFFSLSICAIGGVFAQQYDQSGGIRLGHTSGLTYKKFLYKEEAVEMLLSGRKNGLQVTALYTFHQPMEVSFNENFYVYYGLGAHLGYEKHSDLRQIVVSYDPAIAVYERENYFTLGADVILGVEYRWLSLPMTVGFDIKPYFSFIGMRYTQARFWDAALSVKYVF